MDEHRSHAQLIVLWGVAAPIIIHIQVEINTWGACFIYLWYHRWQRDSVTCCCTRCKNNEALFCHCFVFIIDCQLVEAEGHSAAQSKHTWYTTRQVYEECTVIPDDARYSVFTPGRNIWLISQKLRGLKMTGSEINVGQKGLKIISSTYHPFHNKSPSWPCLPPLHPHPISISLLHQASEAKLHLINNGCCCLLHCWRGAGTLGNAGATFNWMGLLMHPAGETPTTPP